MDDTRERFLTAIVARLGAERIVELHLFSPIRQGLMETGVAVVAALPDLEPEVEPGEAAAIDVPMEEQVVVAEVETPTVTAEVETPTVTAEVETPAVSDEDSPYLDVAPGQPVAEAAANETIVTAVETPAESRHVVFTANYRLTRKGADRGKWAFELTATADAPLATVDMVVRGVMLRSKDLTESERLSGEQLRTLLAEPAWRTTR